MLQVPELSAESDESDREEKDGLISCRCAYCSRGSPTKEEKKDFGKSERATEGAGGVANEKVQSEGLVKGKNRAKPLDKANSKADASTQTSERKYQHTNISTQTSPDVETLSRDGGKYQQKTKASQTKSAQTSTMQPKAAHPNPMKPNQNQPNGQTAKQIKKPKQPQRWGQSKLDFREPSWYLPYEYVTRPYEYMSQAQQQKRDDYLAWQLNCYTNVGDTDPALAAGERAEDGGHGHQERGERHKSEGFMPRFTVPPPLTTPLTMAQMRERSLRQVK